MGSHFEFNAVDLDKPFISETGYRSHFTHATTIDEALGMMTRRRFRHFPVVEDGELIAFISIGDLVKHKMDEVQHEAEALRNYIQAV